MKRTICLILSVIVAQCLTTLSMSSNDLDGVFVPYSEISKKPILSPKMRPSGLRLIRELEYTGPVREKYGYIDKTGKVVVRPSIFKAGHFIEGLAPVVLQYGDKWGFIDEFGKIAIEPKFEWVGYFSEGLAPVGLLNTQGDTMVGYVDKTGKLMVMTMSQKVWDIGYFSEELAPVRVGYINECGYINKTGNWVITPKFHYAGKFSEGLAAVQRTNLATAHGYKWFFIDKNGNCAICPQLDLGGAGNFSEGLAKVRRFDFYKWGYMNKSGDWVIAPQFAEVSDFHEGLAAVKIDTEGNYWGFIDKNGKWVVYPRFDEAGDFSEGLAAVSDLKFNGYWGYIEKKGNYVIKPQFWRAGNFYDGLASVTIGDDSGYIDKTGKFVWRPKVAERKGTAPRMKR